MMRVCLRGNGVTTPGACGLLRPCPLPANPGRSPKSLTPRMSQPHRAADAAAATIVGRATKKVAKS